MILPAALMFSASVLIGSIPWAYLIVRAVAGKDITAHGSGNVGAMNVRRSTGSWAWFAVAVLADGSKGLLPTLYAKYAYADVGFLAPASSAGRYALLVQAAVLGAVVGHNYSLWLAVKNRRLRRTGKGLAAGGGALLAYDWRCFAIVLAVGILALAASRIMLVGQAAAAAALPLSSLVLRTSDLAFAIVLAAVVLAAHANRLRGLLQGREPRMYVDDGTGPRG
ncbi:MAG: glycerol-3-phosphate acyltransferase [Coriobacteriia bacterium]|nr:glycerol-3-phosphate acyltransferase [Coriobacteriia bacterium]